jgi:hypothetical protein
MVEFRTPNQKCHLTIIIYLFNNKYTCVIRFSKVRIYNQRSRQEQKMKKCVEVRTPIREMEGELILKHKENLSLHHYVLEHQKYAR